MPTNPKKQQLSIPLSQAAMSQGAQVLEHCSCLPLSPLHDQATIRREAEEIVPTTPTLNGRLRTALHQFFPRSTPLSVLLIHIAQWEHYSQLTAQATHTQERQRYHAPSGLLEQVMANVCRVIRADEQVLLQEQACAAIIFPDVDQQGAYSILERIYRSISLLQAETVIPPLTLDTAILIGMGSYPEPGSSLEELLFLTSIAARRLTLRPAISTHLWDTQSSLATEIPQPDEQTQDLKRQTGFPFMHLPAEIPTRLKHLIPYAVALELRCAPVGRNHHCLTVAMVDPVNSEHLQRLHEVTGLTIFPVTCDMEELYTLLTKKW